MKKVEVILKVTEACNLKCKYCYNGKEVCKEILSLERFEKLLLVLKTGYDHIHIIWHGGEPLCAGIDYFRKAMDIERKVNIEQSVIIENSIQTNATLINNEWVKFFKEYNFRVGISFDGINNDKYREQSDKVLKAIKLLNKNEMRFGCNAVVADEEYNLEENYLYFKSHNISFDFSKVLPEGSAKDIISFSSKKYAEDLKKLFDKWIYDKDGVSIRTFATYLSMVSGGKFRICSFCSCHMKYLSITPNGMIYNCARASLTKYPFGNIDEFNNVKEIFSSNGALKLISGSIKRREKCKQGCEYFNVCAGGCSDLAILEGSIEDIPMDYCYIFKTVYAHVKMRYEEIIKNNVSLSNLNPTVKSIFANSISKTIDTALNQIADTYL